MSEQNKKSVLPKSIIEGVVCGIVGAALFAIVGPGFEVGTTVPIFFGVSLIGAVVCYLINAISKKTGDKTLGDLIGKGKDQNNDTNNN